MDAVAVLGGRTVPGSAALVATRHNLVPKASNFGTEMASSYATFGTSSGFLKMRPFPLTLVRRNGQKQTVGARRTAARACMGPSASSSPLAPLQLESPVGQFLAQILRDHPHLLPAAVDQQLQMLQTDRDAAEQNEKPAASGTDLVLYRRIAEVKANERRKALEEILYALVVQKFMDAGVPMISSLSQASSARSEVDIGSQQDEKLQKVHSPEAYEMIKSHLTLILGNRVSDTSSIAQISRVRVGQVYMASIMYGYFLKRVDQRFQLEKTMKTLPFNMGKEHGAVQGDMPDESRPNALSKSQTDNSPWNGGTFIAERSVQAANGSFNSGSFDYGVKPYRLRSYVMSFDTETLQRYATIRSKEAISVVENHTEALFGRSEFSGSVDRSKDEAIRISFAGLTALILEAVTFGSFVWDVESYVDSRYHFVAN
ncbi:UV-B-induced protein At3g17800, chloroplastic-like [Nymphaea colorata]|nr:UV-B-induced protein At3g17800, chloroplastic-like [Nymphaea colorata]